MPALNQFKPGPEPGTRFGKLVVLSVGEPIIESGRQRVLTSVCQCDCGNVLSIRNYVLTRQRSPAKSCGCTRAHGYAQRGKASPTYKIWNGMKSRCGRVKEYLDVKVCDRWALSYQAFLEDMGERPDGMTLDRIDPKGDYEPGNCRWASMKQQQNNKTVNHRVTVNGVTRTVSEWMDYHGLDNTTFYRRLKLGWTEEEAAGTPKLARHAKWNRTHSIDLSAGAAYKLGVPLDGIADVQIYH